MAEGGYFGYDDPKLDHDIDHDDDDDYDDDDDDEEQEVNRTSEFQPALSSTQYPEEYEMQTSQHEKNGQAETSYTEETPLMGSSAQSMKDKAWDTIEKLFPQRSSTSIEAYYSPKGKLQVKMAGAGKKLYQLFTKERSTGIERLNPQISDEIRKGLGPPAEEIIAQDKERIIEDRQRLKEYHKQIREGERIKAEKEKAVQEMEDLRIKIERAQARKDQLGSNVENESELRRLHQLIKNYETDLKNLEKEVAALEKQQKKIKKAKEKADKLSVSVAAKEKEKNNMQERLNSTKSLDELNTREAELKREIEEDNLIIDDEETSPSDKEAARERVAEAKDELARLAPQVEERERAMPLRERIKEIFKKYGVTVTSILLAAGVTIGAVIGALTNALKSMGKALGNGLKAIGKKTASLLPGLIGSIVSFLFKTAGQAIGFLAEHTWLLILAVVAFLVEGQIKKQR